MTPETIISICLGIGLSASVGFRVFVPLFALSLACYFDVWELNESWQWLGSGSALVILGVATIIEIFAYFIPFIDNLLDTISIPLATIAGTAVMVATVAHLSPEVTWALAIIAGGGTAAAISSSTSSTRLASSATTAGIGNPVIATTETASAITLSSIAVFLPYIALVFVILILIFIIFIYKKIFKRK